MVRQVEFHHRGVCMFKGVGEPQHLVQLTSARLAARQFPDSLPSKKGKLIAAAQGLQCSLDLS